MATTKIKARRLSAKEVSIHNSLDKIESLSKALSYYRSIGHELAVEDKQRRIYSLHVDVYGKLASMRRTNSYWLEFADSILLNYASSELRAMAHDLLSGLESRYESFVDSFLGARED